MVVCGKLIPQKPIFISISLVVYNAQPSANSTFFIMPTDVQHINYIHQNHNETWTDSCGTP